MIQQLWHCCFGLRLRHNIVIKQKGKLLTDFFFSQGSDLVKGINAFEHYIYRLHKDFNKEKIIDWPTVVLATTLQSTALSLFKLLPTGTVSNKVLDKRSIATLVRNIIDTHDALDMMINADSPERHQLNRNILGMYIAGRINKVQQFIDEENAQVFYKKTKTTYWKAIKNSPLYVESMDKLKNGEGIFYESRRSRVERACGEHAEFVSGVITDLSTYVHSIPPSIWMSTLNELYTDTVDNRNLVAIWLRIANFYMAKSMTIFLTTTGYKATKELNRYIEQHKKVFSE